jgi:hypothetical protein
MPPPPAARRTTDDDDGWSEDEDKPQEDIKAQVTAGLIRGGNGRPYLRR